jgi:hypothetical protein
MGWSSTTQELLYDCEMRLRNYGDQSWRYRKIDNIKPEGIGSKIRQIFLKILDFIGL